MKHIRSSDMSVHAIVSRAGTDDGWRTQRSATAPGMLVNSAAAATMERLAGTKTRVSLNYLILTGQLERRISI
ncbi:hypothetical protein EDD30_0950 [Couchioplanes caeruleus]|uniref:Uncharacterized protein n=1 Tax=Couchioplanes caeruleus TaxID=56438 RepID=A0A3N1GDG6_9ACTN|nr:hypothetical protein EDD30_0950 [Couchioplanes caeruleus]